MFGPVIPIETGKCKTCGKPIPIEKKYCDKECYYKRFTPSPPIKGSVSLREESKNPFQEQLEEEGFIMDEDNIDAEHWCPVCGSRKNLGRCVNFTQHPTPKKPKSR